MEERDTQVDGTKTPELLVDFITSLDGYGAAEGWPGWWGLQGPEYLAWLGKQPEAGYTVLMGANTYRLMSGLTAKGEPGTDALAGMSKNILSRTLEGAPGVDEHATHPSRRCSGRPGRRTRRTPARCARWAASPVLFIP